MIGNPPPDQVARPASADDDADGAWDMGRRDAAGGDADEGP